MFKIILGFWALNGQGSQVQLFLTVNKREHRVNICYQRAPLAKSSNRPAPYVIRLVKLSPAQTQIEEGTLSIWMWSAPAVATSSCFYWFYSFFFFCPQLYNRSSVLDLNLNHIVWWASVSLFHKKKAFSLIWNGNFIDCIWQPLWRHLRGYSVNVRHKSVCLLFFKCSRWLN